MISNLKDRTKMKSNQPKISPFSRIMLWLCDHFEGLRFIQSVLGLCLLGFSPFSYICYFYGRDILTKEHSWSRLLYDSLQLILITHCTVYILMMIFLKLNTNTARKALLIKQLLFLILLCIFTYIGTHLILPKNNLFRFIVLFSPSIISSLFPYFIIRYLLSKVVHIRQKTFPYVELFSTLLIFLVCIGGACLLLMPIMIMGPAVVLSFMFLLGGH